MSPPPQRYRVEAVREEDFPELVRAVWEAFEDPFQSLSRLYCPIVNNDVPASLDAFTQLMLAELAAEPPGRLAWIKVVDSEANDSIVAGSKWCFYQENPHANQDEEGFVAFWHPDGIGREFATEAFRQIDRPRKTMARRPHALLSICGTKAEHRHRGIGQRMVNWGLERADALGLTEAWLDATDSGRPLYARCGFRDVSRVTLDPQPSRTLSPAEREEWAAIERELLPVAGTVMWRPPRGKYIEEVAVKPWEVED